MIPASSRTPVWLLTGWLGSGKTTLLASWLGDPALKGAALIINEIGEVGLDDRLLSAAVDNPAGLIANACVCCTGLPGLEEALADLFWDRLHRRRPAFDCVVVETTGLADPSPIVESLARTPLLRERYVLAGVIVCVSATTGEAVLADHEEARAQIVAADVAVVTKTDRADAGSTEAAVKAVSDHVALARSALGNLPWSSVRELAAASRATACGHADPHGHADHADHADHAGQPHHHHLDHAEASFIAIGVPCTESAVQARVSDARRAGTLLRLKGIVRRDDGVLCEVQWAQGDATAAIRPLPDGVEPPRLGLTCIKGR